jgi:NADH dehydrogenase
MSNALNAGTRPSAASPPSQGASLQRAADAPGTRKRVVIVGAGFGGVAAARALARSEADVILVDRRNLHIFQPLLYQVATAVLAPSEIAAPIRHLVGRQKNLGVLLGEATDVDIHSRAVTVDCPGVGVRQVRFDFLVIATGMRPSYFGHDEFARYAPGLKSLSDAETIRAKILGAYELADATDDEDERARADVHPGWRGPDRCRAGGVDGADGDAHSARTVPTDRRRRERDHPG